MSFCPAVWGKTEKSQIRGEDIAEYYSTYGSRNAVQKVASVLEM